MLPHFRAVPGRALDLGHGYADLAKRHGCASLPHDGYLPALEGPLLLVERSRYKRLYCEQYSLFSDPIPEKVGTTPLIL